MNRTYHINFGAPFGPPIEVIQGENKATTLAIGVQSVVQQWPDATFVVLLRRSDGTSYVGAADLVPDGGKAITYLMTSTDTELSGTLKMQINAMDGDVVVKSHIRLIRVIPSLDAVGPVPEPGQSFVDKVLAAASDAEDARDEAQAAAGQIQGMTFEIDDNGHLIREMGGVDPADIGRVVGDIGPTPNITAGPVTPLPAGEAPTVTITGTPDEPVVNFGIPYGPPADLDEVASRWSFYADGNPVTVYPAAESTILVTVDKACILTYPGGTVALAANTPTEIPAGAGENVLTADNDAVLSISYNRDSMNLLSAITAPVSGTGPVAKVDGAIDGLPMDITARLIATQSGTGDPSPDNVRPIVGRDVVTITRYGATPDDSSAAYPIALPEKMYGLAGAPVMVKNDGTGENPTKLLTLNGTEPWISRNNTQHTFQYNAFATGRANGGVSSHFQAANSASDIDTINNVYLRNTAILIVTKMDINTLEDWITYLAAEYAAGTPVQVLYQLATPETFFVEPFVVPSLAGTNQVWSDGGGDTDISAYQGLTGYTANVGNTNNEESVNLAPINNELAEHEQRIGDLENVSASTNANVQSASTRIATLERAMVPDIMTFTDDAPSRELVVGRNKWKFQFNRTGGYVSGEFVNIDSIAHVIQWNRKQIFDTSGDEVRNVRQSVEAGQSFILDNNFCYGGVGTVDEIYVMDWTMAKLFSFVLVGYTDGEANYISITSPIF